jgi:TrkA domain protein
MQVKTTELPGVGKKYSMQTADGALMVIILHHSGTREIYYFEDPDDDEPLFSSQMSDEEARQIGTILLGVDFQPVADERMEMLLKNVRMDWLKIKEGSCLAGKSIASARIRTLTGCTVIGIEREGEVIGSPDPEEVIRVGDLLMAIGSRDQTRTLESMCKL